MAVYFMSTIDSKLPLDNSMNSKSQLMEYFNSYYKCIPASIKQCMYTSMSVHSGQTISLKEGGMDS